MEPRTSRPFRARSLILIALLGLVASSCSLLEDPIAPWQVDVTYTNEEGPLEARPATVEVDGPFGFVVLTNDTFEKRGFAIEELAVFEEIGPEGQVRIRVEEAVDGETYTFIDHLNGDVKLGTIVVEHKAEDER